MTKLDLGAAMTAAALEDQLRFQAACVIAVTTPATLEEALHSLRERGAYRLSATPYFAAYRAKEAEQIHWLRLSLERDLCPPWLVEMVVARWAYIPEREWE